MIIHRKRLRKTKDTVILYLAILLKKKNFKMINIRISKSMGIGG